MHQPGTNIRNLRIRNGLTQQQLAAEADIDQGWISSIERGKGGYTRESIERIAKALGVSIGVLFSESMAVDAASLGMRRVPLLTAKQVAEYRGLDESEFDWENTKFLFTALARASRHAFALAIGDSFNAPLLDVGDEVIFDMKGQPWPGAVVAAIGGDGSVLIGRFRQLLDQPYAQPAFELVPGNQFQGALSSNRPGGLRLKGVMVEHRRYVARQ